MAANVLSSAVAEETVSIQDLSTRMNLSAPVRKAIEVEVPKSLLRQLVADLANGRSPALRQSFPVLGSQETQCRRSLAGGTQSRRQKETAKRLRDGRLRRRQARARPSASRVNGSESKRGAQPGRRDGRNADHSQVARARSTPPDAQWHQRDRVSLLISAGAKIDQ